MRPSALAAFMLISSSNMVGCSTGRSAGLVPLRTLSTSHLHGASALALAKETRLNYSDPRLRT